MIANTLNKTEIVAFFSSENFFRRKTAESKKELFDSLTDNFLQEFQQPLDDTIFDFLISYDTEQKEQRKQRQKALELKKQSLPIAAGLDSLQDHIKTLPKGRYVLTSAQNNTHVNKTALNCLITFCQQNNAKLLCARLTYNKNGFCQPDVNNDSELWYDSAIKPYLVQGHIDLQGAHFLADANIIPTAKKPCSGFDSATDAGIHCILPHTTISLSVVAALKNSKTKILASTGTITKANYIMRKAGSTAMLNHCIGGLFIDTTNPNNIVIRHLQLMPNYDYIYDLTFRYSENKAEEVKNHVAALQPGDIHAEKMRSENLKSISNLLEVLKPEFLVLHDLLDFSSRNHHNVKDCTFIHKQTVNKQTVYGDLLSMTRIIDYFLTQCKDIVIIESNHDLALNTWLKNEDFKKDPINAVVYLQCMLAIYKYQEEKPNTENSLNMLEYAYKEICQGKGKNVIFNRVDESFIVAGVEMGSHGHNGINGSKGSPDQFRKLGIAMNTGHTHSPSIHGKVYTAGVSASLEMGYNVGASSWMIAHIVTYNNGQRQIIFS